MNAAGAVAAVDLGATSGRVLLGRFGPSDLTIQPIARFENRPVRLPDGLHWSVLELHRHALDGLAAAVREAPDLASIGIDAWGCDYGLLRENRLLGNPYSHRDERTTATVELTHAAIGPAELYARNGLQHLAFNSVFQLVADRDSGLLALADGMLLLPDLFGFWLTGTRVAERTNASTTGLLSARDGRWDAELAVLLDLPPTILPTLVDAGTTLGGLSAGTARDIGTTTAQLTAVASHDTASAVAAVPATDPEFGYISCGTWSLVGVELEQPVLTEASRRARFTNELGLDGRIRYLHNVNGLWLLSETVRDWEQCGTHVDLPLLLAQAAEVPGPIPIFDADDPVFLPPGDMPDRIGRWLADHDLPTPQSRPALVRSILQSLATTFARVLSAAQALSGQQMRAVHLVGGGSQNRLLCQLTADASGLPVFAGPVEATAIGNVLVQARALGWVHGDIETLRALVSRHFRPVRYSPRSTAAISAAAG